MKTISLKLPEAIATRLEAETQKRGVSKSLMVREALAEYFVSSKQNKAGSFLDLAGDLCGQFIGPADLSTNPKHLEDYGE